MSIKPVGTNQTVLTIGEKEVFFSYQTPVAAFVPGEGYIRTSKKWSATTSKHINKWLNGSKAKEVPQSTIDALTA